jgi:hypothetical protein
MKIVLASLPCPAAGAIARAQSTGTFFRNRQRAGAAPRTHGRAPDQRQGADSLFSFTEARIVELIISSARVHLFSRLEYARSSCSPVSPLSTVFRRRQCAFARNAILASVERSRKTVVAPQGTNESSRSSSSRIRPCRSYPLERARYRRCRPQARFDRLRSLTWKGDRQPRQRNPRQSNWDRPQAGVAWKLRRRRGPAANFRLPAPVPT